MTEEIAGVITQKPDAQKMNSKLPKTTWIASYPKRLGALFVDTIVLMLIGFLCGQMLEPILIEMGAWGRLFGFSIALSYFGLMNSSLCHGQTLGKKLLEIKVVNANNETISIGKSLLRYSIFGLPFYFNNAVMPESIFSFMVYVQPLIIFGGIFSIVYLYLFNRRTRQSLHDLAVGTFVVTANIEKEDTAKVWNGHIMIVALFAVAMMVYTGYSSAQIKNGELTELAGLIAAQKALQNEVNVATANVFSGWSISTENGQTQEKTTYVNSNLTIFNKDISNVEEAKRLVGLLSKNYPKSLETDTIYMTLTYGYDIGISSKYSSYQHVFSPDELNK